MINWRPTTIAILSHWAFTVEMVDTQLQNFSKFRVWEKVSEWSILFWR